MHIAPLLFLQEICNWYEPIIVGVVAGSQENLSMETPRSQNQSPTGIRNTWHNHENLNMQTQQTHKPRQTCYFAWRAAVNFSLGYSHISSRNSKIFLLLCKKNGTWECEARIIPRAWPLAPRVADKTWLKILFSGIKTDDMLLSQLLVIRRENLSTCMCTGSINLYYCLGRRPSVSGSSPLMFSVTG